MFVYVQREILTNYQLFWHICCLQLVCECVFAFAIYLQVCSLSSSMYVTRTLFTVICFTIYFSIYQAFIFSAGVILTWHPHVGLYHSEERFVAFWASYLIILNVYALYIYLLIKCVYICTLLNMYLIQYTYIYQ